MLWVKMCANLDNGESEEAEKSCIKDRAYPVGARRMLLMARGRWCCVGCQMRSSLAQRSALATLDRTSQVLLTLKIS